MSYVEANYSVLLGQVEQTAVVPRRPSTSVFQCLVVSADSDRRQMLDRAAMEGGWETVVCADTNRAIGEFHRTRFLLVLVDLEGEGHASPENFRQLCEQVSSESNNVLMAVCGHDGDAMEEIWARQLGVWLYLPGVTDGDDLSGLCSEACGIAEQFIKSRDLAVA